MVCKAPMIALVDAPFLYIVHCIYLYSSKKRNPKTVSSVHFGIERTENCPHFWSILLELHEI
jgi:hypothetical protein